MARKALGAHLLLAASSAAEPPTFSLGACGYFSYERTYEVMNYAAKVALEDGFLDDVVANTSFTVNIRGVDTECDGTRAATVIPPLLYGTGTSPGRLYSPNESEPVVGISGCSCSSATKIASTFGNPFGVTIVSGSATSPDLGVKSNFPYFARTIPPDSAQGFGLARLVIYYGWKRIFIVYPFSAYAEDLAAQFKASVWLGDPSVAVFEEPLAYQPLFTAEDAAAFDYSIVTSFARRVAALLPQPRVFVNVANGGPPMFPMLRAFQEEGLIGPHTVWFIGETFCEVSKLLLVADRQATFAGNPLFATGEGSYDWSAIPELMNGMTCLLPVSQGPRYHSDAWRDFWTNVTCERLYDAGMPSETHFCDDAFFLDLKNLDFSIYVPLIFDAMTTFLVAIGALLDEGVPAASIAGDVLRDAVFAARFEGLSGAVAFDSLGDRRAPYSIMNLQSSELSSVGVFDADTGNVTFTAALLFADGTASAPADAPEPCPRGEEFAGQGGCEECAPGRYSPAAGYQCADCDYGSFQNASGATRCEECPPGTFAADQGARSCLECGRNEHQPLPGEAACSACGPGRFALLEGQSACESCPLGTYMVAHAGNLTCQLCPAGMTTDDKEAMARESCACAAGSYLPQGGSEDGPCLPCPDGMTCLFGSSFANFFGSDGRVVTVPDVERPFPMVNEGFMTRPDDPLKVFRCIDQTHCPGGAPGSCAAYRDGSQVACGRCVEETYESDGECHTCDVGIDVVPTVIAIVVGIALVCAGTFFVNRDLLMQTSSGLLIVIMASQMLLGIQTLSVFQFLKITWIEPLKSVFGVMSLISFDPGRLRVSCMLGPSAVLVYALRQCVAPLAIPWVFLSLMGKKLSGAKTRFFIEASNAIGSIFQVFFISIVISATVPLLHYSHPDGSGSSLVSDPAVLYLEGGEHTSMMLIGFLALGFVVLPFLTFVLYGTSMYPKYVAVRRATDDTFGFDSFRFIFSRFKPECYYMGSFMLVRNLILCLVPVVIVTDVASQVIAVCIIIIGSTVLHLELSPWRLAIANRCDTICSCALLLILVCGALATDADVESTVSIQVIGLGLCCLFFAVGFGVTVMAVYNHFKPSPQYSYFICHHKEDAQAQARLLKVMLAATTGQTVFIDSDDLRELDSLFDIVKVSVKHLVVYLTRDTLRRPWCAGEIVTGLAWRKHMTIVVTSGFVPPSEEELADLGNFLDLSSCSLTPFGISNQDVASAYRRLLDIDPCASRSMMRMFSVRLSKVYVRHDLPGSVRFGEVVQVLQGRRAGVGAAAHDERQQLPKQANAVLISSEPGSDEASAAALILLSKIKEPLMHLVPEGVKIIDEHARDAERVLAAVGAARALLILMSSGTLASPEQMGAIVKAMAPADEEGGGQGNLSARMGDRSPAVVGGRAPLLPLAVPVSLPGFEFPSDDYYRGALLATLGYRGAALPEYCTCDAATAEARTRSFFKRIAVSFPTGASDNLLENQAAEVVSRVTQATSRAMGVVYRAPRDARRAPTLEKGDLPSHCTCTSSSPSEG